MKSLDRQSLEEQTRLVARYVAGDLSRSERAEFEAWLIASPELANEVEMERRLRRGIASAARRGWLKRGTPAAAAASRGNHWRMALAASLITAVAVGWVVQSPRSDGSLANESHAPARHVPLVASRTVHLASVRGAEGAPDIEMALADAPGELVIQPDVVVLTCEDGVMAFECPGGAAPSVPQYSEYEADLVNRDRATLAWRSPRQSPVGGTQLSFTVRDPASFATGDYDFIVRGHSADHEEVVARFVLRIK